MTARSTHHVLVPGLVCTEDLFAEQIASLRGEVAISVADHARHDMMSTSDKRSRSISWHHAGQRSLEGFAGEVDICSLPESAISL